MKRDIRAFFELICSIPHPSGSEEQLAATLERLASGNGLRARRDTFGNLRIDRKASPGYEKSPLVILQGHLDMVPQAAAGENFDFQTEAIPLKEEGGFLRSARQTTLGADNGIGVAAALAMLFDPELKCGPLAGLFTLSEEVGLNGAMALDPDFLQGDYLLNLDSEEEGEFCIGCAGGARLEALFPLEYEPVAPSRVGFELEVGGLAGGHSGINISDRRGNAVRFLGEALERLPEIDIVSITGGSLDNAIPRDAKAIGAADPKDLKNFKRRLARLKKKLCRTFDAPDSFFINLKELPRPTRVWAFDFTTHIIGALIVCPDGVEEYDEALHAVRTSSNLAAIGKCGRKVFIRTSQRSFSDDDRSRLTDSAILLFEVAKGTCKVSNAYPGWEPVPDSELLKKATGCYEKLWGRKPEVKVIHAGLECGIFAGKNPKLQQVSFGPTILDPHSPAERADIASMERFVRFLRELLVNLR